MSWPGAWPGSPAKSWTCSPWPRSPGDGSRLRTVAALAGTTAGTALPLLDRAVRAAVLDQDEPGHLRFSHDLFRDVLYQGLPAARRPELHLKLASLLEQQTGPPAAETAYHRSMAWPFGDRDHAVTALTEAAREATARTAFDEAAAHLRRAVEIAGGASAVDPATLCEYGDALRRAGHGDEAQAALTEAAARARTVGDTALFARAAFGAHRVAAATESPRSAVIALLEEALAALAAAPAPAPGRGAAGTPRAGCCPRRWPASSPTVLMLICPVPSGSPARRWTAPGELVRPASSPMRCSRWPTCAGSRAPRPNG